MFQQPTTDGRRVAIQDQDQDQDQMSTTPEGPSHCKSSAHPADESPVTKGMVVDGLEGAGGRRDPTSPEPRTLGVRECPFIASFHS